MRLFFEEDEEKPMFNFSEDNLNITNTDILEYIKKGGFTDEVFYRTFRSQYELFEECINEIVKYIHYKKIDIVLN